jgi:AP-3 complex subunit delta-1
MSLLIRNAHLLLAGNSSQRDNFCAVLLVAAWICGEYAEYVEDPFALIESMLKLKLSIIPGDLLSAYVMNSMKLYTHQLVKLEAEDDWDGVESLDNLLLCMVLCNLILSCFNT